MLGRVKVNVAPLAVATVVHFLLAYVWSWALGMTMTRLLLDRIEGRDRLPRQTVLPVELVIRETG